MQKIAVLSENLKGVSDAALIFSEINRLYYTSFPSSDGCLLVCADGFARFWTDSRYTEAAGKSITACDVCDSTNLTEQLKEILKERNIKTVCIEADRMTVSEYKKLAGDLPDVKLDDSDVLTKCIEAQRLVKTEEELQYILAAQKIAEDAFDYILGEIKVGKRRKKFNLHSITICFPTVRMRFRLKPSVSAVQTPPCRTACRLTKRSKTETF